jgi:two-component system cell cycle response regulator
VSRFKGDELMSSSERPGLGLSFKKKILIVDDSPTTLAWFAKILSSDVYQTTQAMNGSEALEKAFSELPDLILLDVMMPQMDGIEVTRTLKNDYRTQNTPIILITAMDDQDFRHTGLEAGAEEFLAKPVRRQELIARVNSMITLKHFRDQLAIRNHSQQTFVARNDAKDTQPESQIELPVVLLVEDNEGDAKLIQHVLKDLPLRLERVAYGKDAVELSRSGKVDLILLDIFLPDMDGFEVCRQVKQTDEGRDIPIVIVTCLDDIESKIKSIELNTDDFLVKPIVAQELQARTKILLERKKKQDTLRSHYEAALNSAVVDWLTGLYNQGYFKRFLDLEIKKSLRHRYPISLIMIDIDDFKKYNDIYGHSAGDVLLQDLAQVIRKSVREIDLVARYGGDEFAIVLPYSDGQGGLRIAQRVERAIQTHDFSDRIAAGKTKVTVSMGIAGYPWDAFQAKEIIQIADQRLYSAKQKGKNQISN